MTHEQQRKMLECAAKACGYEYPHMLFGGRVWNPLTASADTAEMCAKLEIDWLNNWESVVAKQSQEVWVRASIKDHDNSRLKAWMSAATMVAAKIGGMK